MFNDPKFWVAIAFVVFIALTYGKAIEYIRRVLDHRTYKIKSELEEAQRLRQEAEQVLEMYKQKQAEYLKEADAMLQQARSDAEHIATHAEQELKTALDERMKNALEKIAQEEEKAIQDVRNHVIDISLAAARSVIAEHAGKTSDEEAIKLAMSDIGRKVH